MKIYQKILTGEIVSEKEYMKHFTKCISKKCNPSTCSNYDKCN